MSSLNQLGGPEGSPDVPLESQFPHRAAEVDGYAAHRLSHRRSDTAALERAATASANVEPTVAVVKPPRDNGATYACDGRRMEGEHRRKTTRFRRTRQAHRDGRRKGMEMDD